MFQPVPGTDEEETHRQKIGAKIKLLRKCLTSSFASWTVDDGSGGLVPEMSIMEREQDSTADACVATSHQR